MKTETRSLAYLLLTGLAVGLIAITSILAIAWKCEAQDLVFRHSCPDAGSEVISECTMRYTQAASFDETRKQIQQAIKNTRFHKKIKFISIDPFPSGDMWDNNRDYYHNMYVRNGGDVQFGVWYRPGKVYVSVIPGCRNIRLSLETLLRQITSNKAKQLPFPSRVKQSGLAEFLAGNAPKFPNLELPELLR